MTMISLTVGALGPVHTVMEKKLGDLEIRERIESI